MLSRVPAIPTANYTRTWRNAVVWKAENTSRNPVPSTKMLIQFLVSIPASLALQELITWRYDVTTKLTQLWRHCFDLKHGLQRLITIKCLIQRLQSRFGHRRRQKACESGWSRRRWNFKMFITVSRTTKYWKHSWTELLAGNQDHPPAHSPANGSTMGRVPFITLHPLSSCSTISFLPLVYR